MNEQKSPIETLVENMSGLTEVIVETKEGIRDFGQRTQQCLGAIHALRAVVAALVKTHPNPEALLEALRQLQREQQSAIAQMPGEAQHAFDAVTSEMTSHVLR